MKRALLLTVLALGCTEPATQVLVVVHSYGLKIGPGGDVDGLHILVKNDAKADDLTAVFDKDNPLCGDLSQQPVCWTLPVTATLVPGPDRANDLVVVKVLGLRDGKQVIGDQASFHFLHDVSQRLDFVLYANCLNVDCTMQDAACNYAGQCQPLQPMTFNGDPQLDGLPPYLVPDLGAGDLAGADLTPARDLSRADLAPLADLSPLSDLTPPPGDLTPPPPDLTPLPDLAVLHDLLTSDMTVLHDLTVADLTLADLSPPDDLVASDLAPSDMAVSLWTPIAPSLPPTVDLRAVWGFGSSDVFVVGTNGTALHSNNAGVSWSTENAFTSENLNAVWGDPSGASILAAGDNGVILLRQSNGDWTPQTNPWTSPIADLRGLWGDAPGDFAVVGSGFSFGTWDGSTWTELCGNHDDVDSYHAVSGTTLSTLLTAGVSGGQGEVRAIQQTICFDVLPGSDMTCTAGCPLQPIFNGGPVLNGVSSFSLGGYAVGAGGTILSCTSLGCTTVPNGPKQELFGVWSEPNGSRNFTVGDLGLIENFTPGLSPSWLPENSGVSDRLNGVWGVSGGGTVYAVGDHGTILQRN